MVTGPRGGVRRPGAGATTMPRPRKRVDYAGGNGGDARHDPARAGPRGPGSPGGARKVTLFGAGCPLGYGRGRNPTGRARTGVARTRTRDGTRADRPDTADSWCLGASAARGRARARCLHDAHRGSPGEPVRHRPGLHHARGAPGADPPSTAGHGSPGAATLTGAAPMAADPATAWRTVAWQAAPDAATSDPATSGHAASGQAAPGPAASAQAGPGQAALGPAALGPAAGSASSYADRAAAAVPAVSGGTTRRPRTTPAWRWTWPRCVWPCWPPGCSRRCCGPRCPGVPSGWCGCARARCAVRCRSRRQADPISYDCRSCGSRPTPPRAPRAVPCRAVPALAS